MLIHLSIRDFAIVDALDLEFGSGFTALTGETGAGKSIVIDALALALGERADANQLRQGCERAEVTAEFAIDALPALQAWLREQAMEGDHGKLLMRRVVERSGRSRGFINGRMATQAQMRDAGDALVDIHGQHEHQSLLKADAQRELLDGHAALGGLVHEVADAYREWQQTSIARVEQETHAIARNAERERLSGQVEELSRLALREGEWGAIADEHGRLANAASLIEGVSAAIDALSESEGAALTTVGAALSRLRPLAQWDQGLGDLAAQLDSIEAQLRDCAHELKHYAESLELDPERLRAVEQRLESIHATARRFRVRPESLPGLLEELRRRLQDLEVASDIETLIKREQANRERYQERARRLSAERNKAAARLARQVTAAMKEMAMTGGRFEVALRPFPRDGGVHGYEMVEFLVAANPGSDPGPLAKVASGGELSRVSLAIQVITSRAAAVPTLIFDEVDAGIGGAVAEVVGKKLRALGDERQILCVTHLPQVAAQALAQWSVSKIGPDAGKGGPVRTKVRVLDKVARVEEIARMLGGMEITPTTKRHAAEMLRLR